MKTLTAIKYSLSCILFLIPMLLMAQAPGFEQDTNDVPIDGGLSLLLAAGIGYGIKRKFNQEDEAKKKKPTTKD